VPTTVDKGQTTVKLSQLKHIWLSELSPASGHAKHFISLENDGVKGEYLGPLYNQLKQPLPHF
jgi:hypothetical protein